MKIIRIIKRKGGFSLTEIMIALAILGVGLSMLMAVFPAAIELNKDSTADVLGTIICQNGLAITKSSLMHPVGGVGPNFTTNVLPLGSLDTSYPVGDGNMRGFLVLARQMDRSRNDYQLVIIAYVKTNFRNRVLPVALVTARFDPNLGANDNNAMYFFVTNKTRNESKYLKVGSPVIDPSSGAYSTIQAVNGDIAILNRRIGGPSKTILNPLVIVECKNDSSPLTQPNLIDNCSTSPATFTMTARTAFRPLF